MYQKMSFTSIIASIIKQVRVNTGLPCYDSVPINAPKPFYVAEMVGSLPEKSKTMMKDRYQVVMHVFAEGGSSVPIYNAIQKLEEALTVDIELPDDYEVTLQIPTGVNHIMDQADGSKHAVVGFDFVVFSGYKMKI